ncbi:serine hydrolase [Pollutibacter soli]|uniref:serine hydrolase domain-containing protein n=1 Tax=Pollutibacter soli TaxID=3034157 RepID=UPI00301355C8
MRKLFKYVSVILVIILLLAFAVAPFTIFPVISGYGAKNMCSAVFLQHRDPADVVREDFFFPISLGNFKVDMKDSSVTGTVWGLSKRKAIFRCNIGSTLINDIPEATVRKQQFTLAQPSSKNTDSLYWPMGDKLRDSLPEEINKAELDKVVASVLNEKNKDGKPLYTKAVLVVYDGQIVAEAYGPGFNSKSVHLGWSMAKTVTAAITGILVKQGKLKVDEPAPVAAWKDTDKSSITIKNLLQQTSGLDFSEVYFRPSSANTMLWSKGDMAAYTESLSLGHPPGTVFNYSSGNVNVMSRIIRDILGDDYYAFPRRELFNKINAGSFLIEPDASGTLVGSSFVYASARDYARFGLLYYNHGNWNGEQILPDYWVKESIQPSSADPRQRYGYFTWLNGKDENLSGKWFPDAPADMYFANGFAGQDIFIIPSEKLILVRLGMRQIDNNAFIRDVIKTIRKRN